MFPIINSFIFHFKTPNILIRFIWTDIKYYNVGAKSTLYFV